MIDVFPFSGFPVAVFGLDAEGLVAAEALAHAEAEADHPADVQLRVPVRGEGGVRGD